MMSEVNLIAIIVNAAGYGFSGFLGYYFAKRSLRKTMKEIKEFMWREARYALDSFNMSVNRESEKLSESVAEHRKSISYYHTSISQLNKDFEKIKESWMYKVC